MAPGSRLAAALMVATTLVGCIDSSGAGRTPCLDEPVHDPAVTRSSTAGVSHNAGQDCLACHGGGGGAQTTFLVAGTIYESMAARSVAPAGSVIDGVGETTLTVDRCGNLYATEASLNGALSASQPRAGALTMVVSTNQPTRRMGSCNAHGCHDFATAWGVHY